MCFLFKWCHDLLKSLRMWSEYTFKPSRQNVWNYHFGDAASRQKPQQCRDCNLSGLSLLPLRFISTNIRHISETEDGRRKPAFPFAYYSPNCGISIIRGICCVSVLLIMDENENRLVKCGIP